MKIDFSRIPPEMPDSDLILCNSNLCKTNHLNFVNSRRMIAMYNYIEKDKTGKYELDRRRLVYIFKKLGIEEEV